VDVRESRWDFKPTRLHRSIAFQNGCSLLCGHPDPTPTESESPFFPAHYPKIVCKSFVPECETTRRNPKVQLRSGPKALKRQSSSHLRGEGIIPEKERFKHKAFSWSPLSMLTPTSVNQAGLPGTNRRWQDVNQKRHNAQPSQVCYHKQP